MRSPVTRLLLPALALTAGLTYMLDPESGRRRRATVRDRLAAAASRLNNRGQRVGRDLSDRAQRVADQGKAMFTLDSASDEAIVRRVRAELERTVSRSGTIGAAVRDGNVTLHGDVLRGEREPLLRAIRTVSGVREIADHLTERDSADRIWSLHVPHEPQPPGQFDFRRERWSPAARSLGGAVAIALLAAAVRGRRRPLGILGGLIGGSLLVRSAVNSPLKRVGPGRGVIDIRKTIVVRAPVERVFRVLEAYQSFPSFLHNVVEVTRHDDGTSHWVVAGPGGARVEWDAVTTVHRPNEILAWRSLPNAAVEHSGVIRVEPIGQDETRLDVRLSYSPPAGRLGHALAQAFRADPSSELDHELARLKRFVETWSGAIAAGMPARDMPHGARAELYGAGTDGSTRPDDRRAASSG